MSPLGIDAAPWHSVPVFKSPLCTCFSVLIIPQVFHDETENLSGGRRDAARQLITTHHCLVDNCLEYICQKRDSRQIKG